MSPDEMSGNERASAVLTATTGVVPDVMDRPALELPRFAESPRVRFIRRFRRNIPAMMSLTFVGTLVAVAILAPWLAPNDPGTITAGGVLADPFGGAGPLGTDRLGRDVWSRMIHATRIAIVAMSQAVLVALLLGVIPGLVAGYVRGWVDAAIMRLTDAVMSFPPLILAIAIVGALGPSLRNAMFAVGVVFAPSFLRLVRGSVLAVREETFIEASRSIGMRNWQIIARHILPNVLSPLFVQTSLAAGFALLAEASLSYLGLGVQPPDASWGSMLNEGYRVLQTQPWLIAWPGLAIGLTVLALNVLGDGIRDSIGKEIRRE